jgi:hypothetical protein
VRLEMKQPMMGELVYDSSDPAADANANPMSQAFSAMVGESFTMIITPEGEVRKIEGMDRIFDKLTGGPQMIEAMKQNMGDEAMRGMMEKSFKAWTANDVNPGDTWNVQLDQPLPMLGTMKSDSTMTLKEVSTAGGKRIARIGTTIKMTLDSTGADKEGLPPGMEMSMTGGSGEGESFFDLDRGQIEKMQVVMQMPMEIKMNVPNGEAMTMKQDMTSTLKMERIDAAPATPATPAKPANAEPAKPAAEPAPKK